MLVVKGIDPTVMWAGTQPRSEADTSRALHLKTIESLTGQSVKATADYTPKWAREGASNDAPTMVIIIITITITIAIIIIIAIINIILIIILKIKIRSWSGSARASLSPFSRSIIIGIERQDPGPGAFLMSHHHHQQHRREGKET